MLTFELWNHESGNAVGEFDTVDAALAVVRIETDAHGRDYAAEWTLVVSDGERTETIALGESLVHLALHPSTGLMGSGHHIMNDDSATELAPPNRDPSGMRTSASTTSAPTG